MKKYISCMLLIIMIFSLFTSCGSKDTVNDTSKAGAYYLMFKELVDSEKVNLQKYTCLSFDTESCGLEGEELEKLREYIKAHCEKLGINYIEYSKVRLRRAFKIDKSLYGEVFTEGYLLTFTDHILETDSSGKEIFSSSLNFWHGDMDGVGALDFRIIKTERGWRIDRESENGGYNLMYQ